MGPFASKNVITEIKIRQGQLISVLGQISETDLPKETVISQTPESTPSKEETETTDTIITEKDYAAERPPLSTISQITVVTIVVLGVLLIMIFVLYLHGRASK